MGAVMGSKNLKAVVVNGSGGLKTADNGEFSRMVRESVNELANSPDTGAAKPEFGTNVILSLMDHTGIHPTMNFHRSTLDERPIDEHDVRKFYKRNRACFSCTIRCSKVARVEEGPFQGAYTEGPEYETVWSFGSHCGNTDVASIIEAEHLCDAYGMDAISVGNVVGFLIDCFEKGLLTTDDTQGLELLRQRPLLARTDIRLTHLTPLLLFLPRPFGYGLRCIAEPDPKLERNHAAQGCCLPGPTRNLF